MSRFIEEEIERLRARSEELRPFVEEAEEIEAAMRALRRVGAKGGDATAASPRVPLKVRKAEVTALVAREPGIRVTSVAKALGVTGPRAVQIVNVLEAEGIVERTADGLVLGAVGQRDGDVSR